MATGRGRVATATRSVEDQKRDLRGVVRLGEAAERVLADAGLGEARQRLRGNIIDKWTQTRLDDREAHTLLRMQLEAFDSLFKDFEQRVKEAKDAQIRLEHMNNG